MAAGLALCLAVYFLADIRRSIAATDAAISIGASLVFETRGLSTEYGVLYVATITELRKGDNGSPDARMLGMWQANKESCQKKGWSFAMCRQDRPLPGTELYTYLWPGTARSTEHRPAEPLEDTMETEKYFRCRPRGKSDHLGCGWQIEFAPDFGVAPELHALTTDRPPTPSLQLLAFNLRPSATVGFANQLPHSCKSFLRPRD